MRLFGIQVTSKEKKPNPKKSFLENYGDHLNFLALEFSERFQSWGNKHPLEILDQELSMHIHITERLRDGSDYFDEVIGATVLPSLAGLAALTALGLAIQDGIQDLAISMELMKPNEKITLDPNYTAATYLMVAAIAATIAIVSFVNSVISLVTRPVVTALDGWKKQDIDRYYVQDSLTNKASDAIFGNLF